MTSTALTDCIGYADTNPDIAGVGVRFSFYLQAFLLVLLVDRSWEDAPIALWTFIATSFGITLAAIIQREQLSFFQALQLSNLIWLANFGIFFSLGTYSRHKTEASEESTPHVSDFKVKYGAMIQTVFSMTLTLYMWAKAPTFGNQPQCSPYIRYMLFAVEVRALGAGRYIGLVMSSILMLLYLYVSIRDIHSGHKQAQRVLRGEVEKNKRRSSYVGSPTIPRLSTSSKNHNVQSMRSTTDTSVISRGVLSPTLEGSSVIPAQLSLSGSRRPKRRRWSLDVDPMLVGVVICQIMVFTYFVVSSELFLKRNPSTSNGATEWGFGQILALIVTTPSALSVKDALMRHGFRRLSRRRKEGAETEPTPESINERQGTELSRFIKNIRPVYSWFYIYVSYDLNSLC